MECISWHLARLSDCARLVIAGESFVAAIQSRRILSHRLSVPKPLEILLLQFHSLNSDFTLFCLITVRIRILVGPHCENEPASSSREDERSRGRGAATAGMAKSKIKLLLWNPIVLIQMIILIILIIATAYASCFELQIPSNEPNLYRNSRRIPYLCTQSSSGYTTNALDFFGWTT